jgi:CheY-like chemotaxis protein
VDILVVDDIRTFEFDGAEVYHARNSKEAIELIEYYRFDAIFLDHDLGGDDTTIRVARFIRDMGYDTPVYIHTSNVVGRGNLMFDLPHAQGIEKWSGPQFEVKGW